MTQYMREKIETLEQPKTAWFLLSMAILLVVAYAYFVNGAISYIVKAGDNQKKLAETASFVSSLEEQYLAAKKEVSLSYALSLGFKQAQNGAVYISKNTGSALSFNK